MTLIRTTILPTPAPTPLELLSRLGTTADEVAASLRDLGIRGQRENGSACPLAHYLQGNGYPAWVGRSFFGAAGAAFSTPEVCSQFVDAFDAGAYPDLVAP